MDRVPALEHLRLLLAVGEEAEAARFVRELRGADVDADALLAPVAATLLERSHCKLALELAADALAADHRCGTAHQVRVDALAELGDLDGAREAAEAWAHADPDCPDAFVTLSWARLADYDDAGAAEAAAQARDLDPSAAGGWLAMAYVSRLGHEWDALSVYCLQALDRDPDSTDARLFLGEAMLAQGRTVDGMAVLRGIDDDRARAAVRHHRVRQLTSAAAIVGSLGLVIGSVAGLGLAGRRVLAPAVPMLLWVVASVLAVAVVRSLL
jgi:tetratricopeptide (TPR) repeat protein